MNRIVVIVATALVLAGSSPISKGRWVVGSESQLTIRGYTNVSTFTCKIEYCTGTDTLQFVEQYSTRDLRFTRSKMSIPIRNFDCGAKPISKDFWRTLKADMYPDLKVNFISLQNPGSKENIKGVVDITLAGSTMRYTICYKVTVNANGHILLQGTHDVKFMDFGLAAPTKLNGLVTVKEGLKIGFHLVLKEV